MPQRESLGLWFFSRRHRCFMPHHHPRESFTCPRALPLCMLGAMAMTASLKTAATRGGQSTAGAGTGGTMRDMAMTGADTATDTDIERRADTVMAVTAKGAKAV